ncbi:hypothetical protein D9619_009200 [Psilocybe cf. subviscida]|uniref:Uncharacterized protein n=1 Tax=Psilocybe cf. subviscida TaxID=2480587 RepID=A0A8H5BUW9_9AGAR|nr:hypothetical protein D9619_009200 [Psilocybe cf. subviscida]
MESLNLNTLASSLPGGQQNAEKELLNDFKAAALSITTLYRSSRKTSKRAFNAGYSAACRDLLNFVQQGVSASDIGELPSGSSHHVEGGGMTIGRVMDWVEARVDAIRAREEEEDEDEEREKDKERVARAPGTAPPTQSAPGPVPPLKSQQPTSKPHPISKPAASSLPTPSSPVISTLPGQSSAPSSPSPPPSGASSRAGARSTTTSNNRVRSMPTGSEPPSPTTSTLPYTDAHAPMVIGAGAKRRHAVMMMLDSNNPAISISPGGPSSTVSSPGGVTGVANPGSTPSSNLGKRRTRHPPRNLTQLQPHNANISVRQMGAEEMDVEEDGGRERKRVARR